MPARLPPFLPALLPSCPPADAPPLCFLFSLHTPWRWCNARTGPDCHAEAAKCGVCENRVRENRETTGFVATIGTKSESQIGFVRLRVHVLKQRTEGGDSGGRGPATREAEIERAPTLDAMEIWV